jgi:hypothetical protein
MHSFRHTVATRALLGGESVDEMAFLLGHQNGNVTRAVYVREVQEILVGQVGRTHTTALIRAKEIIEAAEGTLLGAVATGAASGGLYSYGGYGYGETTHTSSIANGGANGKRLRDRISRS